MAKKFTKTLGTLLLLAVPFLAGCERPKVEPDMNPNPRYAYFNLSESKESRQAGLIVDENRDGIPDYLAGGNLSMDQVQDILFLREGYKPTSYKFQVTKHTRVMDIDMLARAKQSMLPQSALNNAVNQAYKTSK